MSVEAQVAEVTCEVEVVLKDSVFRSFFGFRKQDQVRLDVPAESLWATSMRSELAAAYELYFFSEQGYWGLPMTHGGRKQQVSRMVLEKVREIRILGEEPTAENCELAQLWLRTVAKIASTNLYQTQVSELLREVSMKRLKLAQGHAVMLAEVLHLENLVKEKERRGHDVILSPYSADVGTWPPDAQAGRRFITTAVHEVTEECIELDGDIHVLTHMKIMGQLCQAQSEGGARTI